MEVRDPAEKVTLGQFPGRREGVRNAWVGGERCMSMDRHEPDVPSTYWAKGGSQRQPGTRSWPG
jgi:hypothetical protein